ncbi:MAG: hypothetical protein HY538_07210 [Deltaproteobacteria bacterium]|nr:hypothetical protein [Deltaproteobacteria bacterium]
MTPCYACSGEIPQKSIGRRDVCDRCGADLHCCFQCEFYDEKAHHQCRESQAEWVSDKERANFCDYFRGALNPKRGEGKKDSMGPQRFENLFKK